MSKQIITNNLNEEFNKIKRQKTATITKNPTGVTLGRTAIVEKDSLSKTTQRKMRRMANAQGFDVKMANGSFYHPLFQTTNMMLPRDRRERNEWCRHFYRTEPIVATALDMHTEFPISDFNHICPDKEIKDFFDYMAFDRLNMINLLLDIGLEYWKVGDVFPFGQLNEDEGIWDKFTILNPDYINIKSSVFAGDPVIELLPDEQIRSIVEGGPNGPYGEIYKQLPEDVIRSVKMGRNIHLDNRLVSHISHKASQYEVWGTPILMRCFKTLIYKDRLRQAQDSIATRHITPLRVAKIGAPGEPMPTQDDIDSFRDILLDADQDPNYFIVYHYALQFDYVGSSGKILPLNQEFDFIQKEIMNGLCINQALLNGEGPTYANAQIGMDALAHRYMSYRLRLENWIRQKVYKPIAEIQGFYKPVTSEVNAGYRMANRKDRQLLIPEIRWEQQDLTSNQSVMNFVQQLQNKGLVSMSTVLPMLGLDPDTEKKNLEVERGTVFDPNAPKTGPLPNAGGLIGGGTGGSSSGTGITNIPSNGEPSSKSTNPSTNTPGTKDTSTPNNPNVPQTPASPPSPAESGNVKQTSKDNNNFFIKGEDSTKRVNPRKITKVIHSNQQNKDGEN